MGIYTGRSLPATQTFLHTQGWELDRHDGVVSIAGGDHTEQHPAGLTLTYRQLISIMRPYEGAITFRYTSRKDSSFLREKHLKHKTPEQWFDLLEDLATQIAHDTGYSEICVDSGRKDAAFLLARGYTKRNKYFFAKSV